MTEEFIESARARPAKTFEETLVFRCSKQMREAIEAFSAEHNLKPSGVVRALITNAADRYGINLK